jgi:hypothetical protein
MEPEPLGQGEQWRHRPHPARVGEQSEEEPSEGAFPERTAEVAFYLWPGGLDQTVVLDPRGTGGHTCHASEAPVEMHGHTGHVTSLLSAVVHQHDPASG